MPQNYNKKVRWQTFSGIIFDIVTFFCNFATNKKDDLTMKKEINERLTELRRVMQREHLCAYIFPSTDPHNGEYVPEHWEGRKWISGFTGSAGTAVVTMTSAALWTDSRYFIQAAEELDGTDFQLMKLKIAGTPSIAEWISNEVFGNTPIGTRVDTEVGIDGMCNSCSAIESLITELRQAKGLTLRHNFDPLQELWTRRPAIPQHKIEIQPQEYAGETASSKLTRIRKALREKHADGMLVADLSHIAWALNIRGRDVHCTPLAVAYLLITGSGATIYINKEKLTDETTAYLKAEGVGIDDYKNIGKGLQQYPEYNILMDPDEINYTLYKKVKCKIVRESSPIASMFIVKTDAEVQGYRSAMLKDGIALVRFYRWLKEGIAELRKDGITEGRNCGITELRIDGEVQTELSVDAKLTSLRAEQPLYRGLSFDTISAYGPHGAIVHYEPLPETDASLQPRGFLLLDSGAQYQDGTTDITRTIPLGPLTDEERLVYTLVLKGHIGIELAVFPEGTCGTQLDVLARGVLWRHGYTYMHGTGHGVGSYLSVHEGPHQIRMEHKPEPLRRNMTVTDEPGIYLEGKFGVRIENTLIVTPAKHADFNQFDSLTLCPIDTEPILWELLSQEETDWLNAYHQRVYDTLVPHLSAEDAAWLKKACRPHRALSHNSDGVAAQCREAAPQ